MGVDLVWVKGQAGGRHAGAAVAVKPGGRKQFFFEKKNQKNLCESGPSLSGEAEAKCAKVFCFFFQKRRPFFCTPVAQRHLSCGNRCV
jgi:hypothetical protein